MTSTSTRHEALDGAQLLDLTAAALARYVVLPDAHALNAVTLWVAATHAVPGWHCAPRLVIRAPEKRCGKSRLLDLVEALCHRPLMTVNASPSAVYRAIGLAPEDPPTMLIDEADTIFGPKAGENEDLRGLLNAGHQRGRPALRYDAGSRSVERIETFAMAALAGIGAMPDTIEDRAVIIAMRRRAPGERVQPYRVRRDRPHLDSLRDQLHAWAREHLDSLTGAVPTLPVEDRAADTWEPLAAIADQAGGPWPERVRAAVLAQEDARAAETGDSDPTRLLADLRRVFSAAGAETLPTQAILARLRADDEAPWSTYGGAGLSAMRLGQMLRDFGITSAVHRFPTGQARGYSVADFTDAWARYCPHPENGTEPSQAVTGVTGVQNGRSDMGIARDGFTPCDGSSRHTPDEHSRTSAQPGRQLHLISGQSEQTTA